MRDSVWLYFRLLWAVVLLPPFLGLVNLSVITPAAYSLRLVPSGRFDEFGSGSMGLVDRGMLPILDFDAARFCGYMFSRAPEFDGLVNVCGSGFGLAALG